jgi:hypothetical protein
MTVIKLTSHPLKASIFCHSGMKLPAVLASEMDRKPDIADDSLLSLSSSPPASPPLREISPPISINPLLSMRSQPKPKPPPPPKPVETRFPSRTDSNDRQCTNCGETDTPQWRGTLCNACALWKRSRGTDRPLPLLFPVRRRRSPSPEEYDEEGEVEEEERLDDRLRFLTSRAPLHGVSESGRTENWRGMSSLRSTCCGLCEDGRVVAQIQGVMFCKRCVDRFGSSRPPPERVLSVGGRTYCMCEVRADRLIRNTLRYYRTLPQIRYDRKPSINSTVR